MNVIELFLLKKKEAIFTVVMIYNYQDTLLVLNVSVPISSWFYGAINTNFNFILF
jgi:hypothetical protein